MEERERDVLVSGGVCGGLGLGLGDSHQDNPAVRPRSPVDLPGRMWLRPDLWCLDTVPGGEKTWGTSPGWCGIDVDRGTSTFIYCDGTEDENRLVPSVPNPFIK